jgi:beta-lactamase regulating signal transducer with metallopeptidase domain
VLDQVADQFVNFSDSVQMQLLYASLVVIAAWMSTSIRGISATTKYWIWVVTSLNFALPFALMSWRFWPRSTTVRLFPHAFQATGLNVRVRTLAVLWVIWAVGAVSMFVRLVVRIREERRRERSTPAVEGILKPRIHLPHGIETVLTSEELEAVVIHEEQHARRRDNLIRLSYELALCAVWFHPFVWLAGRRLALYRELSCDEWVARKARAEELIAALAKLAEPANAPLLQSSATSFVRDRVVRLADPPPRRLASAILTIGFSVFLVATTVETVNALSAPRCPHPAEGR